MEVAALRFIGSGFVAASVGLLLLPVLFDVAPKRALLRWSAALALGRVLVGFLALYETARAVIPSGDFGFAEIVHFVRSTHVGTAWLFAQSIAALFAGLALLTALQNRCSKTGPIGLLVLGGATLAVTPLTGHVLSDELPLYVRPVFFLHALAALLWFGGLWAIIAGIRTAGAHDSGRAMLAARRFSRLAQIAMAIVIISGVMLVLEGVGSWSRLFATPYGMGILLKVALLAGALLVALRLMLRLRKAATSEGFRSHSYFRWALLEGALASGALFMAAWIATQTPALHASEIVWPLPFRLSYAATWANGWDAWATAGAAMFIGAAGLSLLPIRRQIRLYLAGAAASIAIVLAGVSLSAPANPDTFRLPTVPYSTVSVERGYKLFVDNCSACHGPLGEGNGPLARSTIKPVANLTEPHAAQHTMGDIFHWISYGLGESMPGFTDVNDDAKWDIINFLRSLSATYRSRLIEETDAGQWLVAPDLELLGPGETATTLSGLRGKPTVISFATCSKSDAVRNHLDRISAAIGTTANHVRIVDESCASEADALTPRDREAAVLSFALFNRSFSKPFSLSISEAHFLIDRSGFVRMRFNSISTKQGARLTTEIERLSREPLRDIPIDHFH